MPRNVVYEMERTQVTNIHHSFTWEEYKDRVSDYVKYITEHKSLGSNRSGEPIEVELQRLMKRSLKLIVPAFFLSLAMGIVKGVADFRYRNRKWGMFSTNITSIFQSIPDFFVIVGFQYGILLLIRLGFPKLPLYGYSEWYHIILPTMFIALFTMMYVAKLIHSLLLDEEGKEYIRTAISKGVSTNKVVIKHMLKNSFHKFIDYLPTIMLVLLTHLIIVEYLMFYQGIGVRFFSAFELITVFRVGTQFPINIPFIIGSILFFTVVLLVVEWLKFIGKALIDPFFKGA